MFVQEGVSFEILVHIVYIKEGFYFSIVCSLEKTIKKYEVRVDVQKRALNLTHKLDNRCVSFI